MKTGNFLALIAIIILIIIIYNNWDKIVGKPKKSSTSGTSNGTSTSTGTGINPNSEVRVSESNPNVVYSQTTLNQFDWNGNTYVRVQGTTQFVKVDMNKMRGGGITPRPFPIIPATPVIISPNVNPIITERRSCDWLDYYLQAYNPSIFPLNCGAHIGRYSSHLIVPSDVTIAYNRCISLGGDIFACQEVRKQINDKVGQTI